MSALVSSFADTATLRSAPAATVTAPARQGRSTTAPPSPEHGAVGETSSDSGQALVLIVISTVATLIVVGALIGALAIDTWWALSLTMVIHFATTGAVFAFVLIVLSGNAHRTLRDLMHPGRRHLGA